MFKRSQATERGEARITAKYNDYFYSALADLGTIYRWKDIPTVATFKPQWVGQDFETWVHVVKTANKLREAWHVIRILEPWIVNKKAWDEYRTHYNIIRVLGEDIEKSRNISPARWKEILEELAWYTTKIGKPVQLFEKNEPRIRVSDVDESGEGSSGNDGDNNDNVDNQSDIPSQAPTDDESTRQDIGTNTGTVPSENTPVHTTRDNNEEVDRTTTTEQTDRGSSGTSGVKPVDEPASSRTHSAAGVTPKETSDNKSSTKQDIVGSTGVNTRSSRAREQSTEVPKGTTKETEYANKTTKDRTEPGTRGAKPKKPVGKSNRRIDSESEEDKEGKTSSSGTSRKRKRSEMEKEDPKVKEGIKIGNPTKWTPGYFTNKKIRQVPSATVKIPGYKNGVSFRSISTQTECSRRRYRFKGTNPVPMNIGDWSRTPMASLDFIRPKHTNVNSTWIEPKEGETEGKYKFKPGTLALAEIKHFMGSEASYERKGPSPSESGFLIPHTV